MRKSASRCGAAVRQRVDAGDVAAGCIVDAGPAVGKTIHDRTLMADTTGRYTSSYDALNRETLAARPNGKTVSYGYDAVSNRAHMVDPDGGRFTYAWRADNLIDHLENPQNDRTTYSYDAASNRTLKKSWPTARGPHSLTTTRIA